MVHEGYALRDLLDYDDGVTIEQLSFFFRKAQRLALERERREVRGLVVALSSLFKADALHEYFAELGRAEAEIEKSPLPRKDAVDRSVSELNKLRALLR